MNPIFEARHLRAKIAFLSLLFVGGTSHAGEPAKEKPIMLPSFVVTGIRIPSSWLEVSWECKGPLPFSPIKRAWISKVGVGTPAEKAGIKIGDQLHAIDGTSVETMNSDRLHDCLQRERVRGTRLRFTIQTPGAEQRVVVVIFE